MYNKLKNFENKVCIYEFVKNVFSFKLSLIIKFALRGEADRSSVFRKGEPKKL